MLLLGQRFIDNLLRNLRSTTSRWNESQVVIHNPTHDKFSETLPAILVPTPQSRDLSTTEHLCASYALGGLLRQCSEGIVLLLQVVDRQLTRHALRT